MALQRLKAHIDSIRQRDPAARNAVQVVLTYPGLHAVWLHRLSSWLWQRGAKLPANFLAMLARMVTGIEIHPAAQIGRNLFIDHGTGVVIGETAVVGDDVTIYQGVSLGGLSLQPEKRHPTVGNGVIIGAGAQLIGGISIGNHARIGANAVVLSDVAAQTTVVGVPAKPVLRGARSQESPDFSSDFHAYTEDCAGKVDPVQCTLEALARDVASLRDRLDALEPKPVVRRRKAGAS